MHRTFRVRTPANTRRPTSLQGFKPPRHDSSEPPPGLRPLTSELSPSSDEPRPRVPTPPGFQSRATPIMQNISPLDIYDSMNQSVLIDRIQDPSKFKLYAKINKSLLFCNPSVFGRALCSEYINQLQELSNQQGVKIASYIFNRQHSKPIIHRQFSYQRQKSWTVSPDDDKEEIVPFDFSFTLSWWYNQTETVWSIW